MTLFAAEGGGRARLAELSIPRSAVGIPGCLVPPGPGGAGAGVVATRGREGYVVSSGRGGFCCGARAAAGEVRTAGRNTEATRPTRPTTAKAIIASP